MSGLSNAMNGASLKFTDTALVQQYANSLKGLNLQQAQLALSTKLLSDEQKEQILVQAGLKASEDAIQAELLQTTLEQKGLSVEKQRAILRELGLMDATTFELFAEKTCTKEKLKGKLAQELKNKTDERGILTTLGLGEANLFAAETFKLMGKQALMALKALATNPATWAVVGIVAITAATNAIWDTTKEIEERLEETKNTIQETESEISSIEQQIEANTQKLEEMRAAGMDESALQTYVKENEELNAQLQLLKDINEEAKKKIAPDVAKLVNNEGKQTAISKSFDQLMSGDIGGMIGDSLIGNLFSGAYFKSGGLEKFGQNLAQMNAITSLLIPFSDPDDDIIARTNDALKDYKKYQEEFDNLNESDFKSKEAYWNKQQELSGKIGESSSIIGANISQLLEYRKELASSDGAETYYADEIKKIDDIIKNYYSANPQSAFDYIFSQDSFSEVKSKLDDFSKSGLGELRKGIQDLIPVNGELYNKLVDFGLITKDNKNWVDELATNFDFLSTGAETAGKNVNKTTVSLSDLEGASDKIGKLSSAFKELSDDGYITTKTLGEIKTATGLADDEWEQYQTKLMNAKAGSAEFNQIMTDLTYKILDNTFAGKELTDVTEDQIAAVLREKGVTNATAVAQTWLAQEKLNAALKTKDLTNMTAEEVQQLFAEQGASISAEEALILLARAKLETNNAKIETASDIQRIIDLANTAKAGTAELRRLAVAKSLSEKQEKYGNRVYNASTGEYDNPNGLTGAEQRRLSNTLSDINSGSFDYGYKKFDASDFISDVKPIYSGGSSSKGSGGSSSKGSGGGSSSKEDAANYKDPTDAIINRINLRATELKQDEELINSKLDLIDTETEYAEAIKLTNSLISNQKLRKEELIKANNQISHEAQYLRDSNPYDEDSWFDSQGEATEAYYSLLNSVGTGTEQEKIETLFKQIQKYKKAYLENEKEIRDVDKDIFENTKKVSDYARNALEKQFKERTENSERWISTEESLDKLNTKEKLAAYKRIIAYHDDFLKQIETDENLSAKDRDELWKEYYDQREDYAIKAYETEREIVDNASSELERIISLETKNLQRKNEELDKSLTKEQKILEIMNSRYDILDKLAEAEHESDKAILESRRSKEYLSPTEYNLLFNEEDYLETKDKIKTLRNESEKLSLDFTAQINKAYAENNLYLAEAITSEYQRQLALKERELEILQREIDLEKKQQQLNNVLAEKNVKFLNKQGQWEWVADLDKVNQAEEDLAEAKYVYDKAVEERNKQLAINLQESVISNIETSMGENDKKIQELEDTIELITEKVDLLQNPIQDITGLVTELASKGIAGMNAALGDLLTMLSEVTGVQYDIPSYIPTSYQLLESTSDLKNVTSLYASEKPQTTFNGVTFDKNFDYQDLINKEKALDYPDSFKLMELMKKREAKLAWIKEYGLSGYALGTKKAQPGLSWVDESGQETYVTSHGVLHNFIGGEMVFNPEQTKNLWELSNIDYSKMFSPQIINMDSLSFKKPEVQNRSYFEGANINVYNPADFNDFMRQMNDTIKNKKV